MVFSRRRPSPFTFTAQSSDRGRTSVDRSLSPQPRKRIRPDVERSQPDTVFATGNNHALDPIPEASSDNAAKHQALMEGQVTVDPTSSPSPPVTAADPLRASPDRFTEIPEDIRVRYAKAIWYERYKGNWVPSIFPPTYINLPEVLLREMCAKTVDKHLMTFDHFARALKYPECYPETQNYEALHFLLITYCILM